MTILIKTLKIMASGVVFVSGITTASSTVYFLPEAKSAGVASSDKNALMFLGMDRDVNLKGICFAMTKQSSSIVPLVDITVKWSTKTGHRVRVFPVPIFRFVWG